VSKTFSRNLRIQILDRRDNALDAGSDEDVSARRRSSVVRMRLERYVRGATFCFFTRDFERDRLSMFDCFE